MYAPLSRCPEATIDFGTPEARAMEAAHAFRARTPCARCGRRRATDWRGDGVTCTRCGAWSPPDMVPLGPRPRSRRPALTRPTAIAELALPTAVPRRTRERSTTVAATTVAALTALDVERTPAGALSALLAASAGLSMQIAARLATAALAESEAAAERAAAPEQFISVRAAAARLGKIAKWLYRRKRLPFMRELALGTWAVSLPALERWMAARARRSP
jgi:hypothetical protein